MRTLSSALLAAQSAPDPYVSVTARFKRRGTFSGDPLAWRPLFLHSAGDLPYGDAGVTAAACACAANGVMVRVLRSQAAMKVGVQRFNTLAWTGTGASWSAAAATALTAAPTQIASLTAAISGESTPAVVWTPSGMFYAYADGGALYRGWSLNDGVSWSAPALTWNLGATYARLTNLALCDAAQAGAPAAYLTAVFNGVTAAGAVQVRGLHYVGGTAQQWPALPGSTSWQVAGVRAGGPYEPTPCLYLYLWGVTGGYSCLAVQRVRLNADGSFHSWDGAPRIVDRAGPGGGAAGGDGVNYARVRLGEAAGAYLFALQERAVNGYWFVSSLFGLPGSLDIEEPVYLAAADGGAAGAASSEYLTPLQCGRRAWLVGAGGVWASAQADEPANLSVRSYTPTSYRYEAAANGGGVLALTLDRAASGEDAPEGFAPVSQPEVYVGDILWLDRTLADEAGDGGTMTLAFRVVQVRYTRASVEVLAADALGVLAHMRPRRAKLLPALERHRMADVDALGHWCGLNVSGSATLPHAVYPSPGFTWPANDSGLSALRRYLADQVTALRSAGAEAGGQDHTTVELVPLPSSSSYTYVSPWGLAEGLGTHEIADWALELDSRTPRLFVAVGLAVADDPLGDQGAKAWSIAAARPLPGSRPYPLSMFDYSYAASDGRVQDLAAGQAQWQVYGLPLGWIEAGANLGIELYDVVTVDQTRGRVVGIVESFERGRLRQRLALAEVGSFGVSVG